MTGLRTIACPHCGGTLEVRAVGYSVALSCRYCGSLLDVSRPEVALIEAHNRVAAGFGLPLGLRGVLFGTQWEVVGAMKRKDPVYSWIEYLLFNPYAGYRWLVVCENEWQFGTMLLDRPEGDGDSVTWRGRRFTRQESEQTATTGTVTGEFYWRVRNGDKADCLSFERNDEILSREVTGDEINWTQLVPVDAGEVIAAFQLAPPTAPRVKRPKGVRPLKEDYQQERDDLPVMLGLALITAFMGLVLMLVIAGPSARLADTVQATFGRTNEGIKIGTITVTRPWQFVTIRAYADNFDNKWVDLDYSLVSRTSGQSIDAYGLVEHYSGRDSDGPWSEGTRRARTFVGQVPQGTYDVYVDAGAHAWPVDVTSAASWARASAVASAWGAPQSTTNFEIPDPLPVLVEVQTNSVPRGNFWTLLLLALSWPAMVIYGRWRQR